MSTSDITPPAPDDTPHAATCPSCGATLAAGAILCVHCGYHLKLNRHLATVVERSSLPSVDPNPYASPAALASDEPSSRPRQAPTDLTEHGAKQAKAIVDEADMVYWIIVVAVCCCSLLWPIILPWYGYRLWCWHRLNQRFSELRYPNSLSPHGTLAGAFQDAKLRLIVGVVVGAAMWLLLALAVLIDLSRLVGNLGPR